MVRYHYNRQMHPPAPFVHVRLASWDGTTVADGIPAQVDTAADLTVIPEGLATHLGLRPAGEIRVAGFEQPLTTTSVYEVRMAIQDLELLRTEVVASPTEPHVLLGRDVLNRHRIVLDGPRAALEIEEA